MSYAIVYQNLVQNSHENIFYESIFVVLKIVETDIYTFWKTLVIALIAPCYKKCCSTLQKLTIFNLSYVS